MNGYNLTREECDEYQEDAVGEGEESKKRVPLVSIDHIYSWRTNSLTERNQKRLQEE